MNNAGFIGMKHAGIVAAIILTIAGNAAVYARRRKGSRDAADTKASAVQARTMVSSTYLDKLNEDDELYVHEEDVAAIAEVQKPAASSDAPDPKSKVDGFRIQCFATNNAEKVRAQKKKAEENFDYGTYIVFADPYYKLHVGDFATRKAAESALKKIRQEGYPEAWIVPSSIETSR